MSNKEDFSGVDRSEHQSAKLDAKAEPLTEDMLREAMKAADRRAKLDRENPLGSEKNPYIVSPRQARYLEKLGFRILK